MAISVGRASNRADGVDSGGLAIDGRKFRLARTYLPLYSVVLSFAITSAATLTFFEKLIASCQPAIKSQPIAIRGR